MIITLTGTPGTGKTSVAEHFSDYRRIDLTEFVKQKELGENKEEFRVEIDSMKDALEEEIQDDEDILIEGHLSHHFPADYCIVLRCHPEELEKRLDQREYPDQKVEENVEAEKLDAILVEAVDIQDKIIEVDTTGKSSLEVAEDIKKRMEKDQTGYGEIDWSETI